MTALGSLGFDGLVEGLVVESLLLGACPGRRTEYGPAVAGRGASSGRDAGRNLVGRMGATERPPWETFVVGSGRVPLTGAASEL